MSKKLLMAVGSKVSQWHDIFCHDPENMSSNSIQVELGACSPVCYTIYRNSTTLMISMTITMIMTDDDDDDDDDNDDDGIWSDELDKEGDENTQ